MSDRVVRAAGQLQAENERLEAKLETEHENFLAVHRDNLELCARNLELKAKLEKAQEVIQEFVNRVESGEVRSKKTYHIFKETLREIGEVGK